MESGKAEGPPSRTTYRHGDLRRALLEAGVQLARDGGPDAVVLREATRRVGVVPNAAYRHFGSRQELLQAVRTAALNAVGEAMLREMNAVHRGRHPAEYARAMLRAVGTAYIRFALAETGLFRTAFMLPSPAQVQPASVEPGNGTEPEATHPAAANPFVLLGSALDLMLEAGVLPPERRPGAEMLAWSAVHGLAMLVIEGPLHRLDQAQAEALGQRVIDMVEQGL